MARMGFNREADDRQRREIHESWDNITCQDQTSEDNFIFTKANEGNEVGDYCLHRLMASGLCLRNQTTTL